MSAEDLFHFFDLFNDGSGKGRKGEREGKEIYWKSC